jgi:hypothetical protein
MAIFPRAENGARDGRRKLCGATLEYECRNIFSIYTNEKPLRHSHCQNVGSILAYIGTTMKTKIEQRKKLR